MTESRKRIMSEQNEQWQTGTITVWWNPKARGRGNGDWVLEGTDREFVGWSGILKYMDSRGVEIISIIAEYARRVTAPAGSSGGFDVERYRIFYRVRTPKPDKPDWYDDPTGRFDHRYWDGTAWTDSVSKQGVPSQDPMDSSD